MVVGCMLQLFLQLECHMQQLTCARSTRGPKATSTARSASAAASARRRLGAAERRHQARGGQVALRAADEVHQVRRHRGGVRRHEAIQLHRAPPCSERMSKRSSAPVQCFGSFYCCHFPSSIQQFLELTPVSMISCNVGMHARSCAPLWLAKALMRPALPWKLALFRCFSSVLMLLLGMDATNGSICRPQKRLRKSPAAGVPDNGVDACCVPAVSDPEQLSG